MQVFQDVRDLAHDGRAARRTARPALGLASSTVDAIELAAKYLRLLGIQRPGPSEHAAAADQQVPAAAFVLHGKPGAEDREVAIALLRARHYAERIRWWVVGQETEREAGFWILIEIRFTLRNRRCLEAVVLLTDDTNKLDGRPQDT